MMSLVAFIDGAFARGSLPSYPLDHVPHCESQGEPVFSAPYAFNDCSPTWSRFRLCVTALLSLINKHLICEDTALHRKK